MNAVIATYYKTEKDAIARAKSMVEKWRGRVAWYVVHAKNGYFVLSETAARKAFPGRRL